MSSPVLDAPTFSSWPKVSPVRSVCSGVLAQEPSGSRRAQRIVGPSRLSVKTTVPQTASRERSVEYRPALPKPAKGSSIRLLGGYPDLDRKSVGWGGGG